MAADIRRLRGGLALLEEHPVKRSQVLGSGGLTAADVESPECAPTRTPKLTIGQ
jgi:hypothetical protein